jgi:hypothetical protein
MLKSFVVSSDIFKEAPKRMTDWILSMRTGLFMKGDDEEWKIIPIGQRCKDFTVQKKLIADKDFIGCRNISHFIDGRLRHASGICLCWSRID